MTYVLFVFISLISFAAPNESEPAPIPTDIVQAVKKWNANFEIFKRSDYSPQLKKLYPNRSPAVVSGDFNGDSLEDFVVFGAINSTEQAVLAVLSDKKNPNSPKVTVVDTYDFKDVKNSEIPSAPGKLEKGVPLYLTIGSGEAADKYRRVHKREVIQAQGYLGSIEQYVIEDSKALKLAGSK